MLQSYLITDNTTVVAVWHCLGRMLQAPLQKLLWSRLKPKTSVQGLLGGKGDCNILPVLFMYEVIFSALQLEKASNTSL